MFNTEEFFIDIRLKGEQELRFRCFDQRDGNLIEVMLHSGGDAECCGAPLGRDVRYRIPPHLIRVAIFSWCGCTLRVFCGGETALQRMEPYVAVGVAWQSAAVELHAALQEARSRAHVQFEQHALAMQHQQQQQQQKGVAAPSAFGVGAGPCVIIAGGSGTGRHALGVTLANLCARTPVRAAAAAVGAAAIALAQQQDAMATNNSNSSLAAAEGGGAATIQSLADTVSAGGCCTLVDCDPLHQTCSTVPLTVGASVWEHTRILDESSSPHFVSFSLASGMPSNADGSSVSLAYCGAATKLLKIVRQRAEANSANRAGWSGSVVIMPSLAAFGNNATAYAAMLYRACEAARADKLILLGGSTKNVIAKLHAEYSANHGGSFARDGGATLCYRRQLRGATSVLEVSCMSACPSAVICSDMVRARLQEHCIRQMLNGSELLPLQQVRKTFHLSTVDIAILKAAPAAATSTTNVVAGFASEVSTTTEVASRVAPEQLRLEGEGRVVAFYSSLHDCTNFGQALGFGVLEKCDLEKRELVVRAPKLSLPDVSAASQQQSSSSAAFVVLPGVVTQL